MRQTLNHPFWIPIRNLYGHFQDKDWLQAMAILLETPNHWSVLQSHASQVLTRLIFECPDIGHTHVLRDHFRAIWADTPVTISPRSISTVQTYLPLWQVKRTGWTRTIPAYYPESATAEQVENVAQHSYKTALLAALLWPENAADAFIMGLIHDLAEIHTGDIPPQHVKNKDQKHAEEQAAFDQLMQHCGCTQTHLDFLQKSFQTYISNHSTIGHIVHIADKLDMAFQALYYEDLHHVNLQEFLDSAQTVIENSPACATLRGTWPI